MDSRGMTVDANQLVRDWRAGDQRAFDRLILTFRPFAASMVVKFKRFNVDVEELKQEALLGMVEAAQRFDPDRGNQERQPRPDDVRRPLRLLVRTLCMGRRSFPREGSTPGGEMENGARA